MHSLYPPVCLACHWPLVGRRALCASCNDQLTRTQPPSCATCSETFSGEINVASFDCPNCRDQEFAFSFNRSVCVGDELARKMVHGLKYKGQLWMGVEMAILLAEALWDTRFDASWRQAIVVPVPLHWRRQVYRHFNQADELARPVARRLGLTYLQALRRIRYTTTQTLLSRAQRQKNLRNAFIVPPRLRRSSQLEGKKIILVDDVFTTGSTVNECARILKKQAAVEEVAVITFMRA
ncbi:ComF family protein [Persicirhabdus sediminis]|nr:ComF family protein [Persicirhabdus sediminis]